MEHRAGLYVSAIKVYINRNHSVRLRKIVLHVHRKKAYFKLKLNVLSILHFNSLLVAMSKC